jgi:hypothetical protein
MVLGERADAFSRQVFARNITNSCKDKLSHQVLAMVFPGRPLAGGGEDQPADLPTEVLGAGCSIKKTYAECMQSSV